MTLTSPYNTSISCRVRLLLVCEDRNRNITMSSNGARRGSSGWMDNYHKLKEYYKIHNHCNVTKKEDPKLGRWVSRQRGERKHYVTPERRELLDKLNFRWEVQQKKKEEENWEKNFIILKEYLEKGNECTLVGITDYNKKLGTWAGNQRKLDSKSKLRPDRKTKLESIQFNFGTPENQKKKLMETLTNNDNENSYNEERKMESSKNVARSNTEHKANNSNKVNKRIGCSVKHQQRWEVMFRRLESYKEEHGDCCVPYKYKEDPSLALWVSTQRREYNQKSWYGNERSIYETRKKQLDSIGFVWDNLHKKEKKLKGKGEEIYRGDNSNPKDQATFLNEDDINAFIENNDDYNRKEQNSIIIEESNISTSDIHNNFSGRDAVKFLAKISNVVNNERKNEIANNNILTYEI